MDIFVGRSTELEATDKLLQREKGAVLVVGETGIGKSRFLAEVYYKYLPKADFLTAQHVCRFSDDEFGPFVNLLAGLVFEAVTTQRQQFDTKASLLGKTGVVLEQLERTFGLGYYFVMRVLEEVNLKLGPLEIKAEKVFRVASETLQQMSEIKPSLGLARQMLSERAPSFMQRYVEIMGALRQDLPNMKLLLILDQVERAKKTTLDMLIDFVEAELEGIYLMLALSEEAAGAVGQTAASHQDLVYLESHVRRLGGRLVRLPGLTVEEIGDWVEKIHRSRPLDIELRHIQKATGGLPLLIEEFLGYEHLALEHLEGLSKREYLDQCYEQRLRHLKHDILDFAYRLSVLQEPLPIEDYLMLLEHGGRKISLSKSDYLRRQLEENLIFGNEGWFRHETIKDYLERRMPSTLCKQYHLLAAKFFDLRRKELFDLQKKGRQETGAVHTSRTWMDLLLNQDYHLRCAGQLGQGLLTNYELFRGLFLEPWFEMPARQRSLEDITVAIVILEKLYDYFKNCGDTLNEANVLLWLGRVKDSQSWLYPSGSPTRTKLWTEAKQLYDRSLELAKPLRDRKLVAEILRALAIIEWHYENYSEAISLMKESLKYWPGPRTCKSLEQAHGTYEIAMCLSSLSDLEYEVKDIGAASRHCKRCLKLLKLVKNANSEWERANLASETFHYASEIIYGLYLLGQIYEARRENRKAAIVYGLLQSCYPNFKPHKDAKTITELMNGIVEKVGEKRFKRYQREMAELGFVAEKNMAASVYKVLDIVNSKLLGVHRQLTGS